jgi:hypothetical protein
MPESITATPTPAPVTPSDSLTPVAPTVCPVRSIEPTINRSTATCATSGLSDSVPSTRFGTVATRLLMSGNSGPRVPPTWRISCVKLVNAALEGAVTMTRDDPKICQTRS